MSVFSRIAIGCANWGKPYGHRGVTCPRVEQEKIVAYAMSCGIDTIHTKEAYAVDLSWVPTSFAIIESDEEPNKSIYSPGDVKAVNVNYDGVVQVPYSPFNRIHEEHMVGYKDHWPILHVRSIFVQGKVFTSEEPPFRRFRQYAGQLGIPVGTLCILFCLLNPNIDKVIVGVDSVRQLRDNLRLFHRLDSFGVTDPKLIDPRTWKER